VDLIDRLLGFLLAILMIILCYQVYLFPQRQLARRGRPLMCRIDDLIPFKPVWVWVYIFAYYPFLISLVSIVPDWRAYFLVTACFLFMLFVQVAIALVFPVQVPDAWRSSASSQSRSLKFLRFIQRIDRGGNCFPSMHVAVAVLSAALISQLSEATLLWQLAIWLFPLAISASTVFTKQHYFLDVPAGVFLGALVFWIGSPFIAS
jgi:membrane-associated phospholipid phosphatase